MAFRCGKNIHIIKYEVQNTNAIPKEISASTCANTKSRNVTVIEIANIRNRENNSKSRNAKFEVDKKNMQSRQKQYSKLRKRNRSRDAAAL